ncbi:desulfoferrodoxin [candidate division KSB1 bacterium]|nr:desulfoferrodoxin [candidate division KSB1 bacterium]
MKRTNIYRCEVCGNTTEVLHVGGGTMVCCNQKMTLLDENSVDAALEKHVPVVEKSDGVVKVKVGSVAHPMEAKHWIQWIEVITPTKILIKLLNPGDVPEAVFRVDEEVVKVREHCNLHGLWKA